MWTSEFVSGCLQSSAWLEVRVGVEQQESIPSQMAQTFAVIPSKDLPEISEDP